MQERSHSRRDVLKVTGTAGVVGSVSGCLGLLEDDPALDEETAAQADVDSVEDLPEEEMVWAHNGPPDASLRSHRIATAAKTYMEDVSGGNFTIDIAAGGELGTTREQIEQMYSNTIQLMQIPEGFLQSFFSDFAVYGAPYIFEDIDLALSVMDGPWGDQLKEAFREETGARIVGSIDTGGFMTVSGNGPVDDPEALEGQSIRTMPMEAELEFYEALGMEPEPMDIPEVYEALDTGLMDAQANPVEGTILFSLYEVVSNHLLDGPRMSYVFLAANDDWFQDLHPVYQDQFLRAGREASIEGRRMIRYYRRYGVEFMENNGINVYEPDKAYKDEIRDRVLEPYIGYLDNTLTNPGLWNDLIDSIRDMEEAWGYGKLDSVDTLPEDIPRL